MHVQPATHVPRAYDVEATEEQQYSTQRVFLHLLLFFAEEEKLERSVFTNCVHTAVESLNTLSFHA